ncbi:prepilin-type N-terminal cleavage/methylation domain-containing protein [Maridesulfovibrio sp.]|uniref:PilW family protein n=1 Tax=Maridesulfovibrio sp. TaxID=2795000 RepID=UPI0029CA394D|nr:prepilin-type N-terminal cleavage/methylation domain-containing protein [Maridesulfovibrio sp.]
MRTRTSPTTDAAGFTLLELLVAITIGSVVLTAVYSIFVTATKVERKAQAVLSPMRSAAYAFSMLGRDVRNLDPLCRNSDISCHTNSCRFPIVDEKGKRVWVLYILKENILWREQRKDKNGKPEKGKPFSKMELCSGVVETRFSLTARGHGGGVTGELNTATKSGPGMIGLVLDFKEGVSRRDIYRSQILLEVTPQQKAS